MRSNRILFLSMFKISLGFVILSDKGVILNKIEAMPKLFTTLTVVNCNIKSVKLFLGLLLQENRQQRTTAMKSLFESKGAKNLKKQSFTGINRD